MTTLPKLPALPDVGLLLLRLAAAAPLFFHGTQKLLGWFGGGGPAAFAAELVALGVPAPGIAAWLAGAAEVGGALVLWLGWPTPARLVLLPTAVTMAVAAGTSARNGFDVGHGGAEYPLLMGVVLIALMLLGPGALRVAPAASRGGAR